MVTVAFLVDLLDFDGAFYRCSLHIVLMALFPEAVSSTFPFLSLLVTMCQPWQLGLLLTSQSIREDLPFLRPVGHVRH